MNSELRRYLERYLPVIGFFSIFLYFDGQKIYDELMLLLQGIWNMLAYDVEHGDDEWVIEKNEDGSYVEDLPVHLVSDYFDLLPFDQFVMFKLFLSNVERNITNIMVDDYL